MLFEKVAKELLKIKNINVTEKYGARTNEFFNKYIQNTCKSKSHSFDCKHIGSLRRFADILDVPAKFIVSILKYERIDENGTNTKERIDTD